MMTLHALLQILQENFPALFHLIQSEEKVDKCVSPIIEVLIEKCENPFKQEPFELPSNDVSNQLSYFPKIRCRGYYNADNEDMFVQKKASAIHPFYLEFSQSIVNMAS